MSATKPLTWVKPPGVEEKNPIEAAVEARKALPNCPKTLELLFIEAQAKLAAATEKLFYANLFPGSFNSIEVRKALQQAAEATVVIQEMDIILHGGWNSRSHFFANDAGNCPR